MTKNFVVLMMGFTGTGKSTLALSLSKAMNTDIFHSALTRKNLGLDTFSKEEAKETFFDLTSNKREEMDKAVYTENCRLATESLKKGSDAIIDSGNFFIWQRKLVYKSVADLNADVIIIRVVCSEEEIMKRLEKRLNDFNKNVLNETPSVKTYYSSKKATQFPDGKDILESGKKPAIIEYDTEKKTVKVVQGKAHSEAVKKIIDVINSLP